MLQKMREFLQRKDKNRGKVIGCILVALVCAVGLENILTADFQALFAH